MTVPKPLGFWVKLVDQLIDEMFATTLEEHGLTRRQWQILSILSRGSVTPSELEVALGPFGESSSGEGSVEQVSELVESDWVAADDEGRLTLTQRGTGAFEGIADVVEEARASVTNGVPPEDFETAAAVLERMARNLGWQGE